MVSFAKMQCGPNANFAKKQTKQKAREFNSGSGLDTVSGSTVEPIESEKHDERGIQ